MCLCLHEKLQAQAYFALSSSAKSISVHFPPFPFSHAAAIWTEEKPTRRAYGNGNM